jgi:hypothetical protein
LKDICSKWCIPDLSKKIPANLLDPSLLEGVYIPNLVASPFAVNKAYAELIYNRTSSPRLSKVLRKWDEERTKRRFIINLKTNRRQPQIQMRLPKRQILPSLRWPLP